MKMPLLLWMFICGTLQLNGVSIAGITPYTGNKPSPTCEIALCCVFQNEAPWLKEWIEYHRLIGVQHFYLYNNLSADDYLAVLKPYIKHGLVELYDFPQHPFRNFDQPIVYNHALERSRTLHKWLAIIDTDEFIVPMQQLSLKAYLRAHEDYAGIYPHWIMYGTSNVKELDAHELLIEKLIHRAPLGEKLNHFKKAIVQPDLTIKVNTAHDCHHVVGGQIHKPTDTDLRLHHYFVRTENFLYQVKIPRLKKWNVNAFSPQSILRFIPIANSEYDATMLRFAIPLKIALQQH